MSGAGLWLPAPDNSLIIAMARLAMSREKEGDTRLEATVIAVLGSTSP